MDAHTPEDLTARGAPGGYGIRKEALQVPDAGKPLSGPTAEPNLHIASFDPTLAQPAEGVKIQLMQNGGKNTDGVRIALRDTSGPPESRIYHDGIKKETPLAGAAGGQNLATAVRSSEDSFNTNVAQGGSWRQDW